MGKKHLSLTDRAETALEKGADESDMTLSEYASKAIIEYSDRDRAARMEDKLDEVLDRLDAPKADGGTLSGNPPEKEKVSPASDTQTFDPDQYDPDADRDPLTKDEAKELIRSVDEPVINPDHVDDRTLSTNNKPTVKIIAGIIRYDLSHESDSPMKLHPIQVKQKYLSEYWDSKNENYYLKFEDDILDEFHQSEYLEPAADGESFTTSYGWLC